MKQLIPGNFYISIIDLFSIFIPGAIMSFVIYHSFTDIVKSVLIPGEVVEDYVWALVLLYGYILGHIINRIGSLLDGWICDPWVKKQSDTAHRLKAQDILSKYDDSKGIESIFTRTKYRIMDSGSSIYRKVEKEMADSKFFRSLFVIFLFCALLFTIRGVVDRTVNSNWPFIVIASLCLGIFSCWSYMKLRYKSTETAYTYLIYMDGVGKLEEKKLDLDRNPVVERVVEEDRKR